MYRTEQPLTATHMKVLEDIQKHPERFEPEIWDKLTALFDKKVGSLVGSSVIVQLDKYAAMFQISGALLPEVVTKVIIGTKGYFWEGGKEPSYAIVTRVLDSGNKVNLSVFLPSGNITARQEIPVSHDIKVSRSAENIQVFVPERKTNYDQKY